MKGKVKVESKSGRIVFRFPFPFPAVLPTPSQILSELKRRPDPRQGVRRDQPTISLSRMRTPSTDASRAMASKAVVIDFPCSWSGSSTLARCAMLERHPHRLHEAEAAAARPDGRSDPLGDARRWCEVEYRHEDLPGANRGAPGARVRAVRAEMGRHSVSSCGVRVRSGRRAAPRRGSCVRLLTPPPRRGRRDPNLLTWSSHVRGEGHASSIETSSSGTNGTTRPRRFGGARLRAYGDRSTRWQSQQPMCSFAHWCRFAGKCVDGPVVRRIG